MSTTVPARHERENEFTTRQHVYEPHKVGLPPILPYVRELWRRREFATEMSRTTLRAQHFSTAFGQLWLVINPILLALVYFILVDILRHHADANAFLSHLMAGIFLFTFLQQSLNQGVKSVVSGGRLILNSAFPRALLPLSAVRTAFMRFLPTIFIYAPIHVLLGSPTRWTIIWAIPIVAILAVFAAGLAMLLAAAQVYFRDIKSFLPYALRIWLYSTPILYYAEEVPDKYQPILDINPVGKLFQAWSDAISEGKAPTASSLLIALAWAVGALVVGGLFFLSREREFAVRL